MFPASIVVTVPVILAARSLIKKLTAALIQRSVTPLACVKAANERLAESVTVLPSRLVPKHHPFGKRHVAEPHGFWSHRKLRTVVQIDTAQPSDRTIGVEDDQPELMVA